MSDLFDTSPPEGRRMGVYEATEALGPAAARAAVENHARREVARASVVDGRTAPIVNMMDADAIMDIATLNPSLAAEVAEAYQRNSSAINVRLRPGEKVIATSDG